MKANSKTALKLYANCKAANDKGALYGFHSEARPDREEKAWNALVSEGYIRYVEWTPAKGAGWEITGK